MTDHTPRSEHLPRWCWQSSARRKTQKKTRPCIDCVAINNAKHVIKQRDVLFVKVSGIRHPQLDATGDVGVGAIDIQETRVRRSEPDELGHVRVIGERADLATLQVDKIPR